MADMGTLQVKQAAEICVFSGEDEASVRKQIGDCRKSDLSRMSVQEICRKYAKTGKASDRCRAFVVFRGWEDFLGQTDEENLKYVDLRESASEEKGKTVFLFPGNGIYQKKMINLLGTVSEFFQNRLEELNAVSKGAFGFDLFDEEDENDVLKQLRVFASELVIAEYWNKTGCKADYIIGHSMGEYAAACFSGVISEKDAITALVLRSHFLGNCTSYRMLAAEASAEQLLETAETIGVKVEISAFNAPRLVTVSGEAEMIERLYQALKAAGIQTNYINTNYGGHFSGLKECSEEFLKSIAGIELCSPSVNIVSTVYPENDGRDMTEHEYWADQIYMPVRFEQAVRKLSPEDIGRVIDIGVTPALLGMAMRNIGDADISWIPTVRAGRSYRQQLYRALGLAFISGIDIDWDVIYPDC